MRHEVVRLRLRQALLHRPLDPDQSGAELVFGELAHRAYAPVAEMVDIVDLSPAVAQLDQDSHDGENVVVRQRSHPFGAVRARALVEPAQPARRLFVDLLRICPAVELHAADRREIVTLFRIEQAVEERLDRVLSGRLPGTHHAIDGDARCSLVRGLVDSQSLGDVPSLVEVVGIDSLDRFDARFAKLCKQHVGNFVVGVGQNLAGVLVDDVVRERAPDHEIVGHRNPLHSGSFHIPDVLDGDALVFLHDRLAGLVDKIEARHFTAQAFRNQLELDAAFREHETVEVVERRQQLLRRHADRLQQDGYGHLAPAIDAEVEIVLGVVLEIEPRTAVGNDAGGEEQLPRGVCLAAIVLEKDPGRAVQLADDHTLGAVDDKRPGVGHERDLAHVHFLLLDLLDRRLGGLLVHDGETHLGAQRTCVGQPALLAFLYVEGRLAQRIADELQARISRVA